MRIVRREAERAVDASLELLGDHVLQPVGFVVHGIDMEAESLCEVELEQPVVPDHLECDALTRVGQLRAVIPLVLEQVERGQLLHHRRRGRG